MTLNSLRVAFLVGSDSRSSVETIEAVCSMPGVEVVGILLDTHRDPFSVRFRNLRRNVKKEGWAYGARRFLSALAAVSDKLAERAAHNPSEVEAALRRAFPDRCFHLADVAGRCGITVTAAGHLNLPPAADALRACLPDLAIVLGTRILKKSIFGIPALGSINVHKGKVPEYRGLPPGFWELYDGAQTAGITVHYVSEQLDAGDILETGEIPVDPFETPHSLREKLDSESVRVLIRAVEAIRTNTARPQKQSSLQTRPRSKPRFHQVREMQSRLPRWKQPRPLHLLFKNCLCLLLFFSGIYTLVRRSRKACRAAILLYHRVNDYSRDVLTVDPATFASQLLAIRRRYPTLTTADLVERLESGLPIPPTAVLIHFDDGYLDVHTEGRPILEALGVPAAMFVNTGFVGTDRRFEHDRTQYPFYFPNGHLEDLHRWHAAGLELGGHSTNHVDLAACDSHDLPGEIIQCRQQLEHMVDCPIDLFSFPYGHPENINPNVVRTVQLARYRALFSAHGGFVRQDSELYDIPRMGVSFQHKPLWLLMEIEGLTPEHLLTWLRSKIRRVLPARKGPALTVAADS